MAVIPVRDDIMSHTSASPVRMTCRLRFHDVDGENAITHSREAVDLSLADASELLDWIEGNGLQTLEVEMTPAGRMTVRWIE